MSRDLMTGTTISHYTLQHKLGEGGMGVVYLAEDQNLQRKCAVKLLSPNTKINDDIKRRFKREAQAIATINHPNIVTIYELGEYQEIPYIIMEYIDGKSLRELIQERKKIPVPESIRIMREVCTGINKAHFAGIIHRDLKPENILVDREGNVKILDFGLAKLHDSTNITTINSRIGTIFYMSPEQVQGDSLKPSSDIFSLGVIFYEMLTGKVPFKGEYDVAVMYSILNEEPEPLSQFLTESTEPLQEIVNRAISKDQDSRFQSSEEFLDALIGLTDGLKLSGNADRKSSIMEEVNHSIDALMAHREKIDAIIEKEYKKNIVIMFSDIVGSTSFFENYGDIEGRAMVKRFNDVAFPVIKNSNGIIIKTMGDGILASFESPKDACNCAIQLQKSMDEENKSKQNQEITRIRVAMHYGKAVIEQQDVYGDVVNVASRVEKHTGPDQIMISKPLFDKIKDLGSFECVPAGSFEMKGKNNAMVLYRLRWNENEEIVTGDVSKESPKSISDEIIIKKKFTTPQPEVIYRESEIGKNPYMNRVMIRDSEDFFGRKSEISKIYSRIGAERPQSVSLVGERRIGKSSLLNFIYDPTNRRQYLTDPDKYIFIFVDFQEKRGIDIPDYFAILYGNLIQEFDNQLEINLKPDYDGFTKVINFLEKQGHKLILVFDEFELITKNKNFNHEFYSYARSLASNYNVAYLVASGKNLQSTCYSSDIAEHPFFNIFSSINIGQFNRAEAAELITIPSKRTGYPLEPYIDQIIDIAGFYPFFVQMACAPFFEFVRQDGKISKRNISNVKEEFLDEAKMHFRQIWDSSDEDQRSLLKELALNKNIENNLEYLLPGLIKSGYVRVEDEKPRLFSSVFTDYINSQFINPEHQTRKKSRFFSLFN